MKMLIISNMAHYLRDGQIVGWGPTVNEINALSGIFETIRHVACLHDEKAPGSALPYQNDHITLVPLPSAGGSTVLSKIDILKKLPAYIKTILNELSKTDAVHIRCPANISLIAVVALFFLRRPKLRWAKYAGSWQSYPGEPLSYKFQRWWLARGFHRGWVTINGCWAGQPKHVRTFMNPCLTSKELSEAKQNAESKAITQPVRLAFAGAITENKGGEGALKILDILAKKNINARLDFLGDGPDTARLQSLAQELGLNGRVTFHGWVSRTEIGRYFTAAHFVLLPSRAEGWPKVLSEAMAYGAVPLASRVGSIPEMLTKYETGKTFLADDAEGFADAIIHYISNPAHWKEESTRAIQAVADFTYERYLKAVRELINI